MKILHAGVMCHGRDLGLSKAFKDLSKEYYEYRLNKDLPTNLLKHNPDIVFLQIQNDLIDGVKCEVLLGGALSQLRARGAFVINWTGDMRQRIPYWMDAFAKYVDVTCFSNERDLITFKHPSAFLQIGFDPKVFKRWDTHQGHNVVFMGNDYGNTFPLGQERKAMVSALQSIKGSIYGNYRGAIKALNPDPNNPFPIQSKESKIYSNSKIGINYSHFNVERYTSDRLFRMLGSGIMVLSHHYKGIEKDFEIGVHLDTFKSISEMKYKIQHFLNHEDDRKRIADAGYELAHNKFTFHHMAKNIIQLRNERTCN